MDLLVAPQPPPQVVQVLNKGVLFFTAAGQAKGEIRKDARCCLTVGMAMAVPSRLWLGRVISPSPQPGPDHDVGLDMTCLNPGNAEK